MSVNKATKQIGPKERLFAESFSQTDEHHKKNSLFEHNFLIVYMTQKFLFCFSLAWYV